MSELDEKNNDMLDEPQVVLDDGLKKYFKIMVGKISDK